MLGEDAALGQAVGEDVGVDLVGHALPALDQVGFLADAGQPRAAVTRDPAHHLRRGEVLHLAAHFPDPAVGLLPVLDRALDLAEEDRPEPLVEPVARAGVDVDRVEHGSPHVVLLLVESSVADAHRLGALVAAEVMQDVLVQGALAVDPVHDLQLVVTVGDVGDEVEEVVGLPVEAERIQAPQREGGVPDPAVAVVPVALAAGRLRQ